MSGKLSTIQLTFNHVVCPPKLPGQCDSDEEKESVQKELITRLLNAIKTLKQDAGNENLEVWHSIENSLRSCMLLNANGYVNKSELLNGLSELHTGASIILHIELQNACIFIRKPPQDDENIIFEAFETSPTAEQALAAKGALQWDFPGVAVSLPIAEFENPVFQSSFSTFIEKTSTETIDEFVPKTQRTGKMISEYRDTVDPAIITQFLMTVLETNGRATDTPILRKRIKDEVCWDDAELPWRRSPFWLALRVCVQRLLYLHLGAQYGRLQYKLLICVFLAKMLEDSIHSLSPEDTNFLKTKLCRRLAKLETEAENFDNSGKVLLSANMKQICQKSIAIATDHSSRAWESFKTSLQRRIPKLPQWGDDDDFRLRLPNSLPYLQDVLNPVSLFTNHQIANKDQPGPNTANISSTGQFSALTTRYSALAEMEMSMEFDTRETPTQRKECEVRCKTMATEIEDYFNAVKDAYNENPEQMSVFLLSLFEMWVRMDKCAVAAHPLLKRLHPCFEPQLLDVLLVSRLKDLERLHKAQLYLQDRVAESDTEQHTIFADPKSGCLADLDYHENPGTMSLELEEKIQVASFNDRKAKEVELDRVNNEFRKLSERKAATTCTQRRHPDGTHDIRGCEYCYCIRARNRLKIGVHEDFLPSDENPMQKRAVLLELGMPESLGVYRNATWNIIATLCINSDLPKSTQPEKLLENHVPLQEFYRHSHKGGITLASYTKSYLGTHYRWQKLPASVKKIMLPFGMKLQYYDNKSKTWLKDFPRELTLAHHFALRLPEHLPFSRLYSTANFWPKGMGPSSYETTASITQCPSTLTVHEFVANKNIVGGKHRRWVSILAELGSANINFSLLDTTYLFRLLVHQAGPRLGNHVRRVVHAVFKDVLFCNRLIDQIEQHVDIISANWRESNYMETMLSMTIQVCALCSPPEAFSRAQQLLIKIRRITHSWMPALRYEMRNAKELDMSEKAARYCFLSALLCRRTFAVERFQTLGLDANEMQCFVEATLAMQEALVVDISKFSTATRNMLIRDIKLSVALRGTIQESVLRHSASLGAAIDIVWPKPDALPRIYNGWRLSAPPYDCWVTSIIASTEHSMPQVVYYHLLEGYLLVDGRPIGKLPDDLRDCEILKELFGNQRLIAFPSSMPGMSYALAATKEDNYIHLGYRKEELVVRAQRLGSTFELVPRHVFTKGSDFDLPQPLVDDCVHWLDLQTGVLQVRPHPRIWHGSSWEIDIAKQIGRRPNETYLVDPHSRVFKSIAQIFSNFELPSMLTVVQPPNASLKVELKRMDLTFYVNRRNLLQCWQLAAEIDPDQDAGTLYGLQSMIVLRSIHNRAQRSIITPVGKVHYQRHGMHVKVSFENDGSHARHGIDNVLGRLSSPSEPRLLYHKALLHALTSCFICDPLTVRTGTEEALVSLQSGAYQPYIPLNKERSEILKEIAKLSPQRRYYPEHKKVQQTVHWNENLTTTIQNDALAPIIDTILAKAERLSLFYPPTSEGSTDSSAKASSGSTVPHLRERAVWRRSIFEGRPGISSTEQPPCLDTKYLSRDSRSFLPRELKVREIVRLLKDRPRLIKTTEDLVDLLDEKPLIGGYTKAFSQSSLEESLMANLFHEWGGLISLCVNSEMEDAYNLMFQLGLLAFGKDVDMTLLRVITSFFYLEELRELNFPLHSSFVDFEVEESPDPDTLEALMKPSTEIYVGSGSPKTKGQKRAARLAWEELSEKRKEECKELAEFLVDQWPCEHPDVEVVEEDAWTHINAHSALQDALPEWKRLYQNWQLAKHLEDVQDILNEHFTPVVDKGHPQVITSNDVLWASTPEFSIPQLGQDLIRQTGPTINTQHTLNWVDQWVAKNPAHSTQTGHSTKTYLRASETLELERMTNDFVNSSCPVQSSYGKDLKVSIEALKMVETSTIEKTSMDIDYVQGVKWLNGIIDEATAVVGGIHSQIQDSLIRHHPSYKWLHQGNLWPCMTTVSILEQLRSTSKHTFGRNMKEALIAYGLAIVNVQRLMRLKQALGKQDKARWLDEYNNHGHVNWDPYSHPDWLLLEIDSNMQIRAEQITVAQEMISPNSGSNSVLQMNMGKGKTSIIIPMIACAIADGGTLSRIMVPKALLSQTAQILQARLGGLLGREITHTPFSRRTPTTAEVISEYRSLHEEIQLKAGVILAVPEHILSFKLSGLQRVSDSKVNEATSMIAIQRWMEKTCRDVLDECDFTLAVKTPLIYPSGSQLALDGHPDRWGVIMAVLGLVVHLLKDIVRKFPKSIDLIQHTDTEFPVAYFLREDVEESLINKLVDKICSSETAIFPTRDFTDEQKKALKLFISEENPKSLEGTLLWLEGKPKLRKNIYLLRGLFVHGILLLCLKKRWNVQYGLHPNRDPMAVPFYAKGVPSEQAEWGHPDVAILFTILAFYHQGITTDQLRKSLQAVLRSDDPATEYDKWTQTSLTLPETLRHWNIINVDDEGQVNEIWRHLRRKMVVINYFLSKFVFPVHAKQFSIKMQASGWDIPLMQEPGQIIKGRGLTTGFSGTNDNRRLVPLPIQQHDLPELVHTNAEVLTYLLQERNRRYIQAVHIGKKRYSELDLLGRLKHEGIRVLIDAGAFILEMSNQALAKAWLEQDKAQAAVYFGPDNKPWVQYPTGQSIPLIATPFADNMENCLIYLDEAHTRGTDLRLPPLAKGALTLGLNQTKDHTVQAAMRLRQLGTTQSITFVAPPEVHQSIVDIRQRARNLPIDSSDVLRWLMVQTCNTNRDLQPLYYAQGVDFCNRMQGAKNYKHFLKNSEHREELLKVLQSREHQMLEELYGPTVPNSTVSFCDEDCASAAFSGRLSSFMHQLKQNRHVGRGSARGSALEEVEQEREVAYEIEEERELQRPGHRKALEFPGLSDSISEFVTTGVLEPDTECIKASTMLESTQLGEKHRIDASILTSHLYVSPEFVKTVHFSKKSKNRKDDAFLRPVNWLLWSRTTLQGLVIIPEEAEILVPFLRKRPNSVVNMILYSAPVTKRMLHFNRIDYYSLPSLPKNWAPPTWLPFEIGILAGRLYFEFSEYENLLDRLTSNDASSSTILNFLQEWLSLRRQGQDISHTPMGYLCQGLPLRSDHPFFSDIQAEEQHQPTDKKFFTAAGDHCSNENDDYYGSGDEETRFAEVGGYEDSGDESVDDLIESVGKLQLGSKDVHT